MLHFTFGESAFFALTLSELTTLENPYYLFVFTRRVPGRVVKMILEPTVSNERVNEFEIEVSDLFDGAEVGQYDYAVYEQEGNENLDSDLATLIEIGVMHLHPETAFTFIEREAATTYISR